MSMLNSYFELLGQLDEMQQSFDALEGDLNDEENVYYLQVLNNCNMKMLQAMQ